MDTVQASERLRLYQSRHTIQRFPLEDVIRGVEQHCSVDGIRIFPVKGGHWRHDLAEVARLMESVYESAWPR